MFIFKRFFCFCFLFLLLLLLPREKKNQVFFLCVCELKSLCKSEGESLRGTVKKSLRTGRKAFFSSLHYFV